MRVVNLAANLVFDFGNITGKSALVKPEILTACT